MKTMAACALMVSLAVVVCAADDVLVKCKGVRAIRATTDVMAIGGSTMVTTRERTEYGVTAQIAGKDLVVVERLNSSIDGTNSTSVVTTNIPLGALPRTFNLSLATPYNLPGSAEKAVVTVCRVPERVKDKVRPEDSIGTGDDYASSVKKILAAGGKEEFCPCAPTTTLEVMVDKKGRTNVVEREVQKLPQQFIMKDGRRISIQSTSLSNGKVAWIKVDPPDEAND